MNLTSAIILLLAILLISARLGLTKVFRKKTVKTGQENEVKRSWWNDKTKSVIIMILLISLVWLSFPSEISRLFSEKPTIFFALVVAVATILVSGGSTNFTKVGLWIGVLAVLIILFVHIFIPANAKNSKSLSPSKKETKTTQIIFTGYTLAQGERLTIIRLQADLPAPKRWTKNQANKWKWFSWPKNELMRTIQNDEPGEIEIHLELPPGLALSDFRFEKQKI